MALESWIYFRFTSGPLLVHFRFITLNFLSDLLGSMNSILVTCKYHTHLIPGVFELLNDIERLDILRLMTFPWQFRYIQKLCMEELYIKWCDFILTGINGYLKIPDKSQTFLVCLRLNSEKKGIDWFFYGIFWWRKHIKVVIKSHQWLHRCWWRMLETKCVGDKFEMLVTDLRCWRPPT